MPTAQRVSGRRRRGRRGRGWLTHPLLDLVKVSRTAGAPTKPRVVKEYLEDDFVPKTKSPIIQFPQTFHYEAIFEYTNISAMRLKFGMTSHGLKNFRRLLANRRFMAPPYPSVIFLQNCVVVVKVQAAHDLPHNACNSIAILTAYGPSTREVEAARSLFNLTEHLFCPSHFFGFSRAFLTNARRMASPASEPPAKGIIFSLKYSSSCPYQSLQL